MSEVQFSIQQEFRDKQEKYVYYIIAISASAIGFSVYKTENHVLDYSLLPLGLAVLSWSMSIFFGLKFLKYVISCLYANNGYYDIIKGRHPDLGSDPDYINAGIQGFREAMKTNGKRMKIYMALQGGLFYSGILSFLVWHVLEMYLRVSPAK